MDLSNKLYDSIKRAGITASKYAPIGALAIGASLYFSSPSKAQTLDSDLDGLDDAYEVSIGTATDNNDTDIDGFYDGIEDSNPSYGDNSDPLRPPYPAVLYDFTNIQESVTQNDNNHRLMPVFSPVDGLSFGYVVAASPGYTNPRIAVANVGDVNSEFPITAPGDLPSPFSFHQLTYNSDGSAILYDNGKDIFAASTLGGGVTQLTDMSPSSFVYNPEVVKINGVDWIVAGGRDSTTTALVAWLYNSTPSSGVDVTTVVDQPGKSENYPRISSNGDNFLFQSILNVSPNVAAIEIAHDLQNIILGTSNPIILNSDNRSIPTNFGNTTNYPGGIGLNGNFSIFSNDINSNYNQSNIGDFSNSNFDIRTSVLGGNFTKLPFPGNQPFASLDKNGTKMLMSSDFNPYLPNKNKFHLLDMSLGTNVSFVEQSIIPSTRSVIDPSGTSLTFEAGDTISFPVGEPNRIKVSTPQIQNATDNELIRNIRTFEPSGTTFIGAKGSGGGITLTYTYRDEDVAGLDEGSLQLGYYDASIGDVTSLATTVDPNNNTLEAIIDHFSSFAIKGIGPSSNKNWDLYK